MTGFCLFCVVCQIWNLNFYVSYSLSQSLFLSPCLSLSPSACPATVDSRILFESSFLCSWRTVFFRFSFFFIERWQSSMAMWGKGLPVCRGSSWGLTGNCKFLLVAVGSLLGLFKTRREIDALVGRYSRRCSCCL